MSLSIGRSLQEGVARTVTRNGLLLVVAWAVVGAVNLLAYNAAIAGSLPETADQPATMIGPSLSISPLVASVIAFVLYLVSFVLVAAALRTFVTDETRTIPGEYFTRNIGWMLLNYVVGYVVFLFAITVGFFLLVIPGIFLLVSLFFWYVFVAVEDQNFVAAFRNSWALTRGNRWSLLGLGVIVMVVLTIVNGVLFLVTLAAPPWVTLVVYALLVSVFGIFSIATAARAYVQLRAAEPGETAATA